MRPFPGRGIFDGPVIKALKSNCPIGGPSFQKVGDIGSASKIVQGVKWSSREGTCHDFQGHPLNSFQSSEVDFVVDCTNPYYYTVGKS